MHKPQSTLVTAHHTAASTSTRAMQAKEHTSLASHDETKMYNGLSIAPNPNRD